MQNAVRVARLAAALAAVWVVAGADWPVDAIMRILGDMGCC